MLIQIKCEVVQAGKLEKIEQDKSEFKFFVLIHTVHTYTEESYIFFNIIIFR